MIDKVIGLTNESRGILTVTQYINGFLRTKSCPGKFDTEPAAEGDYPELLQSLFKF